MMVKQKKTNKCISGAQREIIIREASRIMSQKGYAGTSIQEIGNAVGIHKTTIFHYFKDKQEILLACMRFPTSEMVKGIKEIMDDKSLSPEEALRKAILNHILFLVRNLTSNILYSNEIKSLSPKYRSIYIESRKLYEGHFVDLIKQLQAASGGFFQGLDSKIVAFGILGMCNWLGKWYQSRGKLSPEEITDAFWRMFVSVDHGNLNRPIRPKGNLEAERRKPNSRH